MMNFFHTIGKAVLTGYLAVASLFTGYQAPVQNVGATIPIVVSTFQTSLQASITASATSMTLVTGTDKAGNTLSGYMCFNIDEGTAIEEFVCGTVAGTAVTSMIRGIDPIDGDLEVTALKKVHRRGASVKITNYPSLAVNSRILNGNETLPNPITYASGVGPLASSDLTDKEYVLSVVSGGAVSFEKVVVSGTAGETLSAGNLVYLKASDGRWWKADADIDTTVENVILGIAQGSGTAGNSISSGVLIQGLDTNQTGLSTNTVYYVSNTAGGVSSSVGTKTVVVGISQSTTSLMFIPRYSQQVIQTKLDALVGTSGTPSASNPYATKATTDALSTDVQTFNSSGTWTKPAGAKSVTIIAVGAGGSGAGGTTGGGGAGGGGGGGAVVIETVDASLLGSTETVTVGIGGAAPSGDTNGNNGTASSFGSRITAGGGGGGVRRNGAGGGGGSVIASGSGATGGTPTTAGDALAGQSPTGQAGNGRNAEWAGASGGGGGGSSNHGGSSIYGGGGGGSGQQTNPGSGANGGTSGAYTIGGGGAGGTVGNPGTTGSSNATLGKGYAGSGGGGGSGGNSATSNAGGAGGAPGGGGGGGGGEGAGGVGPGGNGGAGANGRITVITHF